jgi:hypothetical protein
MSHLPEGARASYERQKERQKEKESVFCIALVHRIRQIGDNGVSFNLYCIFESNTIIQQQRQR